MPPVNSSSPSRTTTEDHSAYLSSNRTHSAGDAALNGSACVSLFFAPTAHTTSCGTRNSGRKVIVEHVVDQRTTLRVEQRVGATRHRIERGGIGEKSGAVTFARIGQQSSKVAAR